MAICRLWLIIALVLVDPEKPMVSRWLEIQGAFGNLKSGTFFLEKLVYINEVKSNCGWSCLSFVFPADEIYW